MNDRIVWACDCHVATYQATGWSQDEPCDACGSHVRAYNLDALLRVVDAARYGTHDEVLASLDALDGLNKLNED